MAEYAYAMASQTRRDIVFLVLSGFFITNAILAEIIGVKLILLPINLPGVGQPGASIGVIPWPVVFIATDLINEYFGRDGVKRLTLVTIAMISYAFVLIGVALKVPAAPFSPVNDETFNLVFGQSMWIIIGSIVAFGLSQLIDVAVFWFFRNKTKGKMLWLRATGSTVVSQLIDTFCVVGIAFWLPGKIQTTEFISVSSTNYSYKLLIAIGMTPVIYFLHNVIDEFLGRSEAEHLIKEAAEKSIHQG